MPAACRRSTCCQRSSRVSSLTCSGLESSSGSTSGWRVTMSASPFCPRAAVTTSGTRTLACAAIKVASASCSTCSSRPVGALRGGSLYERRRHCRASLWVSCASRPSTRTFKACPSASWPRYSAAPTCCSAEGLRSPTSIPSEAIASRTCAVGGTAAAVPNASRAIAPAARPRARPANAGRERSAEHDGSERCERHEPRGEHTDRANELRPDNDDDRGRSGEPELRIAPTRQQMRLEREPIGLDDLTQNDCRADDAQCRDEQITHQVPTPAQHDVGDQHDRKPEHAEERRPPKGTGPPEHSRQRLRDVSVLSGRRRRDHCR